MVVWFCCVLVLPNKDGVEVVCCVDAPLKDVVSLNTAKGSYVHTTMTASPVAHRRTALLRAPLPLAAVSVCWLPMRLQRDRRLLAATTVRSMRQRALHWPALLPQACSCYQRGLQMQAETMQVVSTRRKARLTGLVVLVWNRRGRRCSGVEKSLWQMHCFR